MKLGALVKSGPKAISSSKFFGKKKNQTEYTVEQRSLPIKNIKKPKSSIVKTSLLSSRNESFSNSDSSSPFTSRKEKDNDLIGIAKSIEKKVIKIDSLLKESYAFKVKNTQKETQRKRSSKLEEKESDLERKEKSNLQSKIKIPGSEKVGGIFGWLKNFIFWMFLAWLRDKILPFIPTISNILGKALNVASFALEVFGGIVNVLTKFLAGGIRLVNGLTKTLAIVSGARTEEEIESFTKKFNLMMDLVLLAAMLAGDAGFNVLDLFKKKKGRDAAGKVVQKAGGVFKRGLGRVPQRIAAKVAGKKGATIVKGLTTGAKSLGNKATGNIFRRGSGKATQRLAIKLGGKAGGQALAGTSKFLGKAAGPIGTVIGAGFEFAGRKSQGQSNLQAGAGTGASVAGALAGAAAGAKGGAVAGAAIGALFGGVGAAPGAAIGGFIGGIAGAIGGGWLAGKAADKVTGADKVGQPKENTVPGKYRGGIVGKYEKGGIVDSEKPRKEKFQKTYEGKDVGGYSDIVKLFPDPSGSGADGYSVSDNNQIKQKDWWNAIFGGGDDEKTSDSKPKDKDSSHKGKALESLKDTSETFKKNIPFVGELMGASIDIAMGQKPERSIFRKLSERIIYIGNSLSNVEKISDLSDKTKVIEQFDRGGISKIKTSFVPVTEKASEELEKSLTAIIEKGANDALSDIRQKILDAKTAEAMGSTSGPGSRDRDPNARGGYDPRYDQPPSGGGGGTTPSGGGGGTTLPGGGGGGGLGGLTPNAKALLETIKWAEGTVGANAYNTWFGGSQYGGDLSKKTIAQVVELQKRFLAEGRGNFSGGKSAAVGAYQMTYPDTFAKRAGYDINKTYFTPQVQDKLAIVGYMKGQARLSDAEINGPISRQLIAKISGVWASLPNMNGQSAYGQPVKKYSDLEAKYKSYLGSAQQEAKREEEYKGSDPRAKDDDKKGGSKIGGGDIVSIGKNLISQKFAVAEHPDFTKNASPSGGSYTPGKGYVSNVHSGRGHYEGRAIDVTDWTSGYPGRYNSVADSLQKNPAVKMLIHDNWGFYKDGQKSGPGSHSHPTHLHVETKFHGGRITKDTQVKLHEGEFVMDKDSVNLLGTDFYKALNSAENKVSLMKISPDLIKRINEVTKGKAYIPSETDSHPKGEGPRDKKEEDGDEKETAKNLQKAASGGRSGRGGGDIRDRDVNARGGFDPRYDDKPAKSGGGSSSSSSSVQAKASTPMVEMPGSKPKTGGSKVNIKLTENQKQALAILGKYESAGSGGYNAVNQIGTNGGRGVAGYAGDFTKMDQHGGRALTDMSISEILALQSDDGKMSNAQWIQAGKLHAVGRYQFIGNTLPGVVERAGIPKDAKFTKEIQDLLALQLMKERGISPWVGPSDKATAAERAIIEKARGEEIVANVSVPEVEPKEPLVKGQPGRPVDPGDVEADQQIAGNTKGRYGRIGIPNTDGQDTGADIELFGQRGEIGKSFGDNSKQGPYGNRGVEISFPYDLIYLEKVPGGRNAGHKSIDVQGSTSRDYKAVTGSTGFGHVGSYYYKDPKTGKMFEVMMGHGNKPFKKFKEGEIIKAGTVVGWQGASGSSDSMQGGVYDHVTFHVNAVDGGDPGPIFNKFVDSLVSGKGAQLTAQQREEKKNEEKIAKNRPKGSESVIAGKPVVWDGKDWKPKPKDTSLLATTANVLGKVGNSLMNAIIPGASAAQKPAVQKPAAQKPAAQKPATKPERSWYDPRGWIGKEGGGLIGKPNVKTSTINNVSQFSSYEEPGGGNIVMIQEIEVIKYINKPSSGIGGVGGMITNNKGSKSDNSYMLRRQ